MKIRAVRFVSCVALAAGALSWIPSQAAELGFYVGGAYGPASKDIEKGVYDDLGVYLNDVFGYVPTSTASTFDNEDNGYSFVGGYRLYSWLAVEGGYLGLGKQRHHADMQGNFLPLVEGDPLEPSPLTVTTSSRTTGLSLSALGILPLSYRWEVYGRVGVLFATNELTLYATDGVVPFKQKFNSSGTGLLAGAGASFTFAEIYALRAEYQRVFGVGDVEVGAATVGDADTDLITLGLTVKF